MINNFIPKSNTELIRDKIIEILISETNNQVLQFYNTDCDNVKFYSDRIVPVGKEEPTVVVVSLLKGKFQFQTNSRQDGDVDFLISVICNSASTQLKRGDKSAAAKLHRWMFMIRYILMHQDYGTLNMPDGIIGGTDLSEFAIDTDLEKSIDSSNNSVGHLILRVSLMEESEPNTAIALAANETKVFIELTDKGYEYTLNTQA